MGAPGGRTAVGRGLWTSVLGGRGGQSPPPSAPIAARGEEAAGRGSLVVVRRGTRLFPRLCLFPELWPLTVGAS